MVKQACGVEPVLLILDNPRITLTKSTVHVCGHGSHLSWDQTERQTAFLAFPREGTYPLRERPSQTGNVSRSGASRRALGCGRFRFLPWLKHRGFHKRNSMNFRYLVKGDVSKVH